MKVTPLRDRTKQFALRIIRMFGALPKTTEAQVMGKQVLRSGTSVAANDREASRARSNAEFISIMGIVERELDETVLWLELLVESGIVTARKMSASSTRGRRVASNHRSINQDLQIEDQPKVKPFRIPPSEFRIETSNSVTFTKGLSNDKATQHRHDRLRLHGPSTLERLQPRQQFF